MKCVILQPSYIPWRGYFHQILKSDIFVFYDDVQYDKRGWRNRNKIKTGQGTTWLTIPVHSKGVQLDHTPINQIQIDWEQPWHQSHLKSLKFNYAKAPFFNEYIDLIAGHYNQTPTLLVDFIIPLTIDLARTIGISSTKFVRSSELQVTGTKTDRLIEILTRLGADHYISGPSANAYIEEEKFRDHGITLEYMNYDYPEYPQLYPPFDPRVSILDLLFMVGPDVQKYFNSKNK
jgi:hypothetical protein